MSAPVRSRPGVALVWLPDLLPLAVAAFSVPTVVLLIAGQFHAWLVLPIGLAAATAAVLVVGPERRAVPRLDVTWSVLALGLVAVSVLANAALSSQDIVVTRDPGTYATTAQWLADHSSLPIPTARSVFEGTPGLSDASLGFQTTEGGGAVDPQGNHLTQALVALVGSVLGPAALLKANAVIGGIALLSFFGLARRFAGGGWALLVTMALAGSMPMLHFVRALYTEPLTLAMVVGGLSLLWRAQEGKRRRDAAAAGLVLGTSALARIDGSVSLLFLLVLVAVSLALAPRPERGRELVRSAALLLGAAVPTAVGLTDLRQLAPGYERDLASQLGLIEKAFIGLLVVGVVVVLVGWRTRLLERVLGLRLLPKAAAVGVLGYCALLASRPLWLERHAIPPVSYANLAALQRALRQKVEVSRSYDESTVTWLSWYYGWPALVLAAVGLAVLTGRCLRGRDLRLLPALTLLGSVGSLYLWNASIFPDQIWAARRFLPVVIPLLLVAAAFALSLLWTRGTAGRVVAGLLGLAVVVMPLLTSWPLATFREGLPQLSQVQNVCRVLPDDAAVLLADPDAQERYAVTLRAYCNVPTVGISSPTAATLGQARRTAITRGRSTWVVATRADGLPLSSAPARGFSVIAQKWEELLDGPPLHPNFYTTTLYVGQVGPDGRVQLSAPAAP